jgi:hypothetical protein
MSDLNAEVQALADALGSCLTLENSNDRDDCITLLPEPIPSKIRRRSDKRGELINIVRACSDYEGGIDSLVKAVNVREQDSNSMQLIRKRGEELKKKILANQLVVLKPEADAAAGHTRQGFALVIGIGKYLHGRDVNQEATSKRFTNLSFAANDAKEFADFLKKDDRFHIDLLCDEQAGLRQIMRSLDNFRKRCRQKPNPLAVLFFSGHGARDGDGRHYLIPHDAERDDLFSTALWSKTLNNALTEVETDKLVVFLDTCHSGGMDEPGVKDAALECDPSSLVEKDERHRRYVIASCMAGQQSRELDGNGIFTRRLLDLLRCETEDDAREFPNEDIDLWQLYCALRKRVEQTAVERCEGAVQQPYCNVDRETGVILAINQIVVRKKVQLFEAVRQAFNESGNQPPATVVVQRLQDFVEHRRRRQNLDDARFYNFFTDHLRYWSPGAKELIRELNQDLVSAYDAAMGVKATPARVEAQAPAVPVERGASARLGSSPVIAAPERRCLPYSDLAYVLERINEIAGKPKFAAQAAMVTNMLSRPDGLSEKEFAALLQRTCRDADQTWIDHAGEIGRRFDDRWQNAFGPGPWAFAGKEVVNLAALAAKLREPLRTIDGWLQDLLQAREKETLIEFQSQDSYSEQLQSGILLCFNTLVHGSSIWDAERFSDVDLRAETEKVRAKDPQGEELQRLNRLLLEDAYPQELVRKQIPQDALRVRMGGR